MQKNQSTFKRLIDNFLSLSALQGINIIVPLITFPYLVRVLGVEQFGLFAFVMAVINYVVIITDYGFDLSATKHISTYSHDKDKIDEIFSSVIMIKGAMMVLMFMILSLCMLLFEKFSQHSIYYFLAFGLVVGQVFFPVWFFQGIEKMRYITILNAVSKTIFTIAIFLFVHEPDDLYLVFVFNSMGAILSGFLAFYVARVKFDVSFVWQSQNDLLFYLKDAWYIFTSRVAVQLYQGINIIILGFFVNNTVVGYYAIVEKIVRAIGSIMISLTRALYPYLNRVYDHSKVLFYKRNAQLSLFIFIMMLPVAVLTFIFSKEILSLVMGTQPPDLVITLLHIFSPILAFYLYGNQFTNMLVILNEKKLLNAIVLLAGIINLVLAPLVIYLYGALGLIWLNLFVALFIYMSKGYYIYFKFRPRDVD